MNAGRGKGLQDLLFPFREGGQKELVRDLGTRGGGGGGGVVGRRKKGDGLKHGDMGTEKGDFDRDFHFQKEEPTDVVGEIEVDVPKDLFTHSNGSGAKNALLDVLEGAITPSKGG